MKNISGEIYRLQEQVLINALQKLSRDIKLVFFRQTDSTNTRANEFLKSGIFASVPFVVVAASQTQGRGRFSRKWIDEDGKSICFTIAFPISEKLRANFSPLGVLAGINMCKALCEYSDAPIMLKWPNDLYISEKKFGGMIAEAHAKNGELSSIIFGVGINFAMPSDSSQGLICGDLSSNSAREISINQTCVILLDSVLRAFESIVKNENLQLEKEFEKFDFLRGKHIGVDNFNTIRRGVACGVNANGELKIADDSGNIFLSKAGEASIVKSNL